MAELSEPVTSEEQKSSLNRIIDFIPLGAENERCCRVLKALSSHSGRKVGQEDLALELGLSVDDGDKDDSTQMIRLSVEKLRNELLPRYYTEHPRESIKFEIPKNPPGQRGYCLLVTRQFHSTKYEDIQLFFDGRENTKDWFRHTICESSEVLFVSVGMQHALDLIVPWFKDGLVTAKHFRVLTWRPKDDSMDVVSAFTDHTEEEPERFLDKQRRAWLDWKRMEGIYPFVEVCGYESIPTMQGVCNADHSIVVELFPFHRADTKHGYHSCGTTAHRPMIFAESGKSPQAFWLFKHAFEDLWFESLRRASLDAVHPRWQENRTRLFRERGLPSRA